MYLVKIIKIQNNRWTFLRCSNSKRRRETCMGLNANNRCQSYVFQVIENLVIHFVSVELSLKIKCYLIGFAYKKHILVVNTLYDLQMRCQTIEVHLKFSFYPHQPMFGGVGRNPQLCQKYN